MNNYYQLIEYLANAALRMNCLLWLQESTIGIKAVLTQGKVKIVRKQSMSVFWTECMKMLTDVCHHFHEFSAISRLPY